MESETTRQSMELDTNIYFVIVIPDGGPHEATPTQGFAMSLCEMSWAISTAALMPTSIHDLTDVGRETLLARRMSGTAPVRWYGQSPRALQSMPHPAWMPFTLVILPPSESVADYQQWLMSCPTRPTIVAESGGDLDQISIEALKMRFLEVCNNIGPEVSQVSVENAKRMIASWGAMPERELTYQVLGHNTITPNLSSLTVAGFENLVSGRFNDLASGTKPYVDQIVKTTNSIFDERNAVGGRDLSRIYVRVPDLNLFAPSIYPQFFDVQPPVVMDRVEKRRFLNARLALQRQAGYGFEARTNAQIQVFFGNYDLETDDDPTVAPNALVSLRASEFHLNTALMSALTASEFSSCVRLPNEINRTSGTVRNFAEHYRSDRPSSRKRLLAFRSVQSRLKAAVPSEFFDLIRRSETGVRIVSDAHLEWLDVDGLPLALRKNCTRIPVTPGNLFVSHLAARHLIHLTPESFKSILVISGLRRDDPIRRLFEVAFETFEPHWRENLTVEYVEVTNEAELVQALNEFDGPMVVFDGHGSHSSDGVGLLHLGDESIDVWDLEGKIEKMPPIVVLSACDTHAADRNHATTANGFMSLGARTVLSSVFPLLASDAASFTARLVYRVSEFIPAAIRTFNEGITWTEVISGMLRMQLLTDFLRLLLRKNLIDEDVYEQVHTRGNNAINSRADDPFSKVLDDLEGHGVSRINLKRDLELAIANSSVLSYLQIGRPETIIIDEAKRVTQQLEALQ